MTRCDRLPNVEFGAYDACRHGLVDLGVLSALMHMQLEQSIGVYIRGSF